MQIYSAKLIIFFTPTISAKKCQAPTQIENGSIIGGFAHHQVAALADKVVEAVYSVNDLPIAYNIAWYEQKAVIVLLALLSLGVKNIHSGPTLPAFFPPEVLKVLQEKFGIGTITNVDEDIKILIGE